MSPSKGTLIPSCGISSVHLAASVSLPCSLPLIIAFCTACSISRCELTPTIFRNLRILRLKVSWSISSPGEHFLCHFFAQLDPPLVEAVDIPDDTLREHLVLVQRNQPPEVAGRTAVEEQHARGPVSRILAVRRQLGVVGAEGERIGLGLGIGRKVALE